MRRLTPWLFALAVALWFGGMLVTRWLTATNASATYNVAANELYGVSSVVVTLPPSDSERSDWYEVRAQFGPHPALVATLSARSSELGASIRHERHGNVLYLHTEPNAQDPAQAPPRLSALKLPLSITSLWLQAGRTRIDVQGHMPTLTVKGQGLSFQSGAVDDLHLVTRAPREDDSSGRCGMGRGSYHVDVDAEQVTRLDIETAGSQVSLKGANHLQSIHLLAPPDTSLLTDHVGNLSRLKWEPMPADQLNELSLRCPTSNRNVISMKAPG